MNRTLFIFIAALMVSLTIQAQQQEMPNPGNSNPWWNLLWTVLPMILVFAFFFVVIRKLQKKTIEVQNEYRAKSYAHMERVEKLLERIANAVENKT